MNRLPRVFADFNDLLRYRDRVRLRTHGARADLERQGLTLEEGIVLQLYDHDENDEGERDDLIARGTVYWDEEEDAWMARLDLESIQNESEVGGRRCRPPSDSVA
jgi:hypothetical protein